MCEGMTEPRYKVENAIFFMQRDFELLSFLVIVLAVKNRKWKPGISIDYLNSVGYITDEMILLTNHCTVNSRLAAPCYYGHSLLRTKLRSLAKEG